MNQDVNIYVPGILTCPGESDNWSGRAVTHTHLNSDRRAEKVEYFTTPLTRPFGQKHRAQKLVLTVEAYAGWKIRLVGHSNGCDVILDALAADRWPAVDELHLVCAACEADFDRNGLNDALRDGRVGKVVVYIGGKDAALRWARTPAGRLLGYGTLGVDQPKNVAPENETRIAVMTWPGYGHSDCWSADNFARTMQYFLAA